MIKQTNHRKNYFDLDIAITHSGLYPAESGDRVDIAAVGWQQLDS